MDAQPPMPPEIWEHTPPVAQKLIVAQAAALAQLWAAVAQLPATIEEVAQRWERNSRNSSQPPSADPPHALRQSRREPSGRRPGGQHGHEGQTRALVPLPEVAVVIPVKPVRCPRGQHSLQGEAPPPQRPQVTEIPPRRPVRREVERLLDMGQPCEVPKTAGGCREMLKVRPALWTFVHHGEVEPTHNAAESAIQPGVRWRQGSLGTHSPEGPPRCADTIMTVAATLKPQQRHVLDALTVACEAALHGQPAPSLLLTPDQLTAYMLPAL